MSKRKPKTKIKQKLVQAFLPDSLYQRFKESRFRTESNTDGEALRAILKSVLHVESESQ